MVDDVVQVARNRADIFRDRPFVVVQNDDESFRLRLRVVERLVTDAAGKRGVSRHYDDVFVRSAQIAPDRHSQAGGKSGAGVPGAVAIVFAFGPQQKSVQSLVLPHRADAIEAAGKHFVDVTLVADVEDKSVLGSIEDAVQRDGQFDHAEIWTEMAAGLRKDLDQIRSRTSCASCGRSSSRSALTSAGERMPSSNRVTVSVLRRV